MAETSTYLYAISKAANTYSEVAINNILKTGLHDDYYVEYNDIEELSNSLYYLAIFRYCGERKMRETIKSYSCFIELWLREYIYDEDTIWNNMVELNYYLKHYWNCQPKFEW